MTKFQITSDLHAETMTIKQMQQLVYKLNPAKESRVLLLAGDIATTYRGQEIYSILSDRFERVVKVLGNHTSYAKTPKMSDEMHHVVERLTDLVRPLGNVEILNNGHTTVNGQRIVGCTGWFREAEGNAEHSQWMPDFQKISCFQPYHESRMSELYLASTLRPNDILLMHHIPRWDLVAPRWQGDSMNRFFVAGFEDVLDHARPRMVVYGHTHDSNDAVIGDTRYVCNPHGYMNYATNKEFQPQLLVTTSDLASKPWLTVAEQ